MSLLKVPVAAASSKMPAMQRKKEQAMQEESEQAVYAKVKMEAPSTPPHPPTKRQRILQKIAELESELEEIRSDSEAKEGEEETVEEPGEEAVTVVKSESEDEGPWMEHTKTISLARGLLKQHRNRLRQRLEELGHPWEKQKSNPDEDEQHDTEVLSDEYETVEDELQPYERETAREFLPKQQQRFRPPPSDEYETVEDELQPYERETAREFLPKQQQRFRPPPMPIGAKRHR
jgi:hypothetical protein